MLGGDRSANIGLHFVMYHVLTWEFEEGVADKGHVAADLGVKSNDSTRTADGVVKGNHSGLPTRPAQEQGALAPSGAEERQRNEGDGERGEPSGGGDGGIHRDKAPGSWYQLLKGCGLIEQL